MLKDTAICRFYKVLSHLIYHHAQNIYQLVWLYSIITISHQEIATITPQYTTQDPSQSQMLTPVTRTTNLRITNPKNSVTKIFLQ